MVQEPKAEPTPEAASALKAARRRGEWVVFIHGDGWAIVMQVNDGELWLVLNSHAG